MDNKIRYPVGEQSFKMLRQRGCLYVDKTHFIEKLLDKGSKYYFLARPRRFGKSLFLSMMKSFFLGERSLFKGLYAERMVCELTPHPVLYLDLNIETYRTPLSVEQVFEDSLRQWESEYGIKPEGDNLSVRFKNVIRGAYEKSGMGVVILVDEYDKPLVSNLHDREVFESFREQLTAIYSNFKSSAEQIRMVFLTGVSRFAHLSVFSGLNNITDITFLDEYSDICGISEEELVSNFREGVAEMAGRNGKSVQAVHDELKQRYDGYRFSEDSAEIYNPYSLLNVMESGKMENYWIKSGVPLLLEQQLKRFDVDLKSLFETRCSRRMLEGLDLDSPNPVALLYQTGYLTIKNFHSGIFTLGIPNEEVKEGFLSYLLPKYASIEGGDTEFYIYMFIEDLKEGRIDDFMRRLKSMFAAVPYQMEIDNEKNMHNALLMLTMLLGMKVQAEYSTSDGRVDMVIGTDKYLYIIELKIDRCAQDALDQINAKDYALPFSAGMRDIIKVGVNFSTKKRRITDWAVEK